MSAETRQAVALSKSYVGAAFLCWLLYYVGFWVVGFVVNLVYLSQAKRVQRETQHSPSGKGCLSLLLFVHFWLPLMLIVGLIVLGVVSGGAVMEMLSEMAADLQESMGLSN